jgi:Tfp pilus assembly protein PilF
MMEINWRRAGVSVLTMGEKSMKGTRFRQCGLWVVTCLISASMLLGCGSSQQLRLQADDNYRLAQQYLGDNSYLLAEQEIRKSLDAIPDDPHYFELLALIYQAEGRLKHADEAYRAALRHQDVPPSVLVNYSSLLLLQGRYDDAISTAQRALEHPNYDKPALAHTNIGLAYLKKADLSSAAEHLRTALDYYPNLPEAHHNLGLVYARSGKYNEAILSFREAIRTRPSYPEAYVSLAQILLEEGRNQEARDAFERVIDLAPDSTFAIASRRQLQRLTP